MSKLGEMLIALKLKAASFGESVIKNEDGDTNFISIAIIIAIVVIVAGIFMGIATGAIQKIGQKINDFIN